MRDSVSQDRCLGNQEPVEGRHLFLRPVLLEEAEGDGQRHDPQNKKSGQPTSLLPRQKADRVGQRGGEEQHPDEEIGELPQQKAQRGERLAARDFVWAEPRQPLGGLGGR